MTVKHIDRLNISFTPSVHGGGVAGEVKQLDALTLRFLDRTVLTASVNPVITPGEVVSVIKSAIAAAHPSTDGSIIKPRLEYFGMTDLTMTFLTVIPPILRASIRGWVREVPDDLAAWVRVLYHDDLDIASYIGGHLPADVKASIRGWLREVPYDIPTYIGGHLPADLSTRIHGYPPADLLATIIGVLTSDLAASIYGIPPSDLSAIIHAIYYNDLPSVLHGYAVSDLTSVIRASVPTDLPAFIRGVVYRDLSAFIYGIASTTSDLAASLYGYLGVQVPYDLVASIRALTPEYFDFVSYIRGWSREVTLDISAFAGGHLPSDLSSFVRITDPDVSSLTSSVSSQYATETEGFGDIYIRDLVTNLVVGGATSSILAYINAIFSTNLLASLHGYDFNDLSTTITSSGGVSDLSSVVIITSKFADLSSSIAAKVMWIISALPVNTLNYTDLKASIGWLSCLGASAYGELASTIHATYYANLSAQISNELLTSDLSASINSAVKWIDRVNISFNPVVRFTNRGMSKVYDAVPIIFDAGFKANLAATITSTPRNVDLTARISGLLPSIKNIKFTKFIRYINLDDTSDQKQVELVLDDGVGEYYYFGELNELSKSNQSSKWKIDVSAYTEDLDQFASKSNVRHKTVSGLGSFGSLDSAIKHAIKLATEGEQSDLISFISASGGSSSLAARLVAWPSDKASDLSAILVCVP